MENNLIVTAKRNSGYGSARFVWSANMQECDCTAIGISDEDLDMLMANKVHEGADLAGWTVTIA